MSRDSKVESPRGVAVGPRSDPDWAWFDPQTNRVTFDKPPTSADVEMEPLTARVRYLSRFIRTTFGRIVHASRPQPCERGVYRRALFGSSQEALDDIVENLVTEQQLLWRWAGVALPAARVLTRVLYGDSCAGDWAAEDAIQEWLRVDGHPVPPQHRGTEAPAVVNRLIEAVQAIGPETTEVAVTVALDPPELCRYLDKPAETPCVELIGRLNEAVAAATASPDDAAEAARVRLGDSTDKVSSACAVPRERQSLLACPTGACPTEQPLLDQPVSTVEGSSARTRPTDLTMTGDTALDWGLLRCFDSAAVYAAVVPAASDSRNARRLFNPYYHADGTAPARERWAKTFVWTWVFRVVRRVARQNEESVRPLLCPRCVLGVGSCSPQGCIHKRTIESLQANLKVWADKIKTSDPMAGRLF
jgi:hypothetical protein